MCAICSCTGHTVTTVCPIVLCYVKYQIQIMLYELLNNIRKEYRESYSISAAPSTLTYLNDAHGINNLLSTYRANTLWNTRYRLNWIRIIHTLLCIFYQGVPVKADKKRNIQKCKLYTPLISLQIIDVQSFVKWLHTRLQSNSNIYT